MRIRKKIVFTMLFIYITVMTYVLVLIIYRHYNKPKAYTSTIPDSLKERASSYIKVKWCQPQKYIRETINRSKIGLVSYPGSGNTWLRYLLQQSTGILTGSVYRDYWLLLFGMYGESTDNKSVSVIKNDEWGEVALNKFDKAILLIRPAWDAIQSQFNEEHAGHLGLASIEQYENEWVEFVEKAIIPWRNIYVDWLVNYHKPLLIVLYEDLMKDTPTVMRSVINFLELPVTSSNFQCTLRRKHGIFKRKRNQYYETVPDALKEFVKTQHKLVYRLLTKRIKTHVTNHVESPYYKRKSFDRCLLLNQ